MSKYKGIKISFKNGYNSLPINRATDVKQEIMRLLDIKTNQSWHRYMRGEVYITPEMKKDITEIFIKYNVINDVWI